MTPSANGVARPTVGARQMRAARLRAELEETKPVDSPDAANGPSDDKQPEDASGTGPVGQGDFVVRQGDCISSIAKRHGHLWETIWDEPANAEMRQVRHNPNVLLPDDRVTIPPIRPKSEQGAAEMRHRFRKKGQPETYQVRVLREDKPRGNEPYELDVDGKKYSGVTDADGNIVVAIAPDANYATLTVGTGENEQTFHSQLGEINPLEEVSGVQQRLNNLGFECGPADGELGDETRDALRIYQKKRDLPVTGEPDEATRRKLQDEYGC